MKTETWLRLALSKDHDREYLTHTHGFAYAVDGYRIHYDGSAEVPCDCGETKAHENFKRLGEEAHALPYTARVSTLCLALACDGALAVQETDNLSRRGRKDLYWGHPLHILFSKDALRFVCATDVGKYTLKVFDGLEIVMGTLGKEKTYPQVYLPLQGMDRRHGTELVINPYFLRDAVAGLGKEVIVHLPKTKPGNVVQGKILLRPDDSTLKRWAVIMPMAGSLSKKIGWPQ